MADIHNSDNRDNKFVDWSVNMVTSENIRLDHKKMTDQECYEYLKNSKSASIILANKWRKMRLIELKKEGITWSE